MVLLSLRELLRQGENRFSALNTKGAQRAAQHWKKQSVNWVKTIIYLIRQVEKDLCITVSIQRFQLLPFPLSMLMHLSPLLCPSFCPLSTISLSLELCFSLALAGERQLRPEGLTLTKRTRIQCTEQSAGVQLWQVLIVRHLCAVHM